MVDPARLLEDALKLPATGRAALAARLIESLETEVDEDAEAGWGEEIARRIGELDTGKVHAVPWSETRRRILAAIDGRPRD